MIDVVILVLLIGYLVVFTAVTARKALRTKDIKTRYAVTLKGSEGSFAGLLVDESWRTMIFENCVTVPDKVIETAQPILGRVHVDRSNIAYRQELPNDPV